MRVTPLAGNFTGQLYSYLKPEMSDTYSHEGTLGGIISATDFFHDGSLLFFPT